VPFPAEAVHGPADREVAGGVHHADGALVAVAVGEAEQRPRVPAGAGPDGLLGAGQLGADVRVGQRGEVRVVDGVVTEPVAGCGDRGALLGEVLGELAGEEERRGHALAA